MSREWKTVFAEADILYQRAELQAAIARMADDVCSDYAIERPLLLLTVMHGGMPFAAEFALALGARGIDLELDYLHASRYRGRTSGGRQLEWLHRPETPLQGRRVLLADDILDEGHTLLAVRHWCRRQGAEDVRVAVLALKRHERRVDGIDADYVGVEVPDRYVFGYGMDFEGRGRNLPAIYALRD